MAEWYRICIGCLSSLRTRETATRRAPANTSSEAALYCDACKAVEGARAGTRGMQDRPLAATLAPTKVQNWERHLRAAHRLLGTNHWGEAGVSHPIHGRAPQRAPDAYNEAARVFHGIRLGMRLVELRLLELLDRRGSDLISGRDVWRELRHLTDRLDDPLADDLWKDPAA